MPTAAHVNPTSSMNPAPSNSVASGAGAKLVCADGRELVLRSVQLSADAAGGLCRVRVEQRWVNPYAETLRVEYKLPLPADAAVSGYAFEVEGRRTEAEIARKQDARAAFEDALVQGHTAALLEQERSSLFTQELGNIPPGEEIYVCVDVDQPLKWIEHASADTRGRGGWEWRFPTVVAPRYLGSPSRVPGRERVEVDLLGPLDTAKAAASAQLQLRIRDGIGADEAHSPSHLLASGSADDEVSSRVLTFAPNADSQARGPEASVSLDRDVVVRWPVSTEQSQVQLRTHRPDQAAMGAGEGESFALLALVPPSNAHERQHHARDLCVLFDVSGSMAGEPIAQAKQVVHALIDAMGSEDQLEMIAFSWRPTRWKRSPVRMSPRGKASARRWLNKLAAGGATEMRDGILEALRPLRSDAQRQVLLVSDGLIGFEAEIVGEIRRNLPANSRVHCLGVGHGVNRSLTGPAARAGAGVELIVAPGEDAGGVMQSLLARTTAPQLVDLQIEGSALLQHAPASLPDLYAGAPSRIALRLRAEGGELVVRAEGPQGSWTQRVQVPALKPGEGAPQLASLFGREAVEDLESARAGTTEGAAYAGEVERIDAQIEALGLRFGISTRATSWIAVDKSRQLDATAPTREVQVPHVLAAGMSVQGLGLRAANTPVAMASFGGAVAAASPMMQSRAAPGQAKRRVAKAKGRGPATPSAAPPAAPKAERTRILGYAGSASAPPADAESDDLFDNRAEERADEALSQGFAEGLDSHPAEIQLVAKVRAETHDTLVLTVALDVTIEWDPREPLRLVDASGRTIEATIEVQGTTAAGTLAAGLSLRICLKLDPTSGAASPIGLAHRLHVGDLNLQLQR